MSEPLLFLIGAALGILAQFIVASLWPTTDVVLRIIVGILERAARALLEVAWMMDDDLWDALAALDDLRRSQAGMR